MSGSPFAQRALSYNLGRVRDAIGLVVHDDGEQVVAIREAVASQLVDEDAEFSHCSLDKKKAGENVPGTWKPPIWKTNHFI